MSCTTDANGQAAVQWGLYSLPPLVAVGQGQVTASNGGSSVVFIESASQTISALTGQPVVQPSIVLQNLLTGNTQLSGNVGQTLQGAIQVGVVTGGDNPNQPIRGVGVVVTGDTSGSGPTVTCANADTSGAVLTDATGVASCDLLIGGRPGTTPVTVTVGGGRTIWSGQILLTAAATPRAATLSVMSGNNQSGNVGTALPAPLVVRVLDQFGNPLPGQTVSFSVSNPSGVTLSANSAQTNSNGQASVTATLGTVPGPHTVTATVGGNITATFTVTANANLGAVTVVSGGGQTATIGRAFTNPLIVKLTDTTGKPLPNTSVSFAVTSGSATLSANSAVTDANGNASVNVTAGQTAGPVVVTATSGNFSATFNLTVQPNLFIRSVVNGANFVPGLAPGAIATIVGTGIAGNVTGVVVPTNVVGPLPTTLGGVSVTINGIQAPMFSVSNVNGAEQINVQVPFEVTPGQPATVVVNTPAGTATLNNVSVQSVQPAIFENVDAASGNRYAVAQRLSDGAYVTPATPVTRGQRVRVYLTGLGQTNPTAVTNQGGIAGQRVLAPLIVGINNAGIPYEAAEYLPGSNGVYMVTFVVPVDAPTGPFVPLSFGAIAPDGSVQYSQGSTLSIQ
jgi:uncharacterized protein (TIGR03437 family)